MRSVCFLQDISHVIYNMACLSSGVGEIGKSGNAEKSGNVEWVFAWCSKLGNNVFVCEQCGWAHLCGDACTERFMDLSSELPVCPISGRCFTRMMTWAEVGESQMCLHLFCQAFVPLCSKDGSAIIHGAALC